MGIRRAIDSAISRTGSYSLLTKIPGIGKWVEENMTDPIVYSTPFKMDFGEELTAYIRSHPDGTLNKKAVQEIVDAANSKKEKGSK